MIPGLIPFFNIFTTGVFILNRKKLESQDRVLIGWENLLAILRNPRNSLKIFYTGVSIFISITIIFFSLNIILFTIISYDSVVGSVSLFVMLWGMLGIMYYRSYTDSRRRELIDISVRDLTIRIASVLGITVMSFVLMSVLTLPVIILLVPISFLNESLYQAVGSAPLFAFFLLPISVSFVLILRILPWISALPLIINNMREGIEKSLKQGVPILSGSESAQDSEGLLPTEGHSHTDVSIDSETVVDLSGVFGYIPRTIEELQVQDLPSSKRRAIRLFIPPYLIAAGTISFFQYRPEQAAALSSKLPAENILIILLSYIGIPEGLVERGIAAAGLAPETISLGFVGVVVPGLLMAPSAWHIALEYEGLQYRLLKRLDRGNQHLLIWVMQFVMPLILVYLWLVDRRN